MSDYAVTLPVPAHIYDRARQIAVGTAQSVEAVLLQQLQEAFVEPLPALPPDEQRELEALTSRMRRCGRLRVHRWPRTGRRVCTCLWMRTHRGRWKRPSEQNWRPSWPRGIGSVCGKPRPLPCLRSGGIG